MVIGVKSVLHGYVCLCPEGAQKSTWCGGTASTLLQRACQAAEDSGLWFFACKVMLLRVSSSLYLLNMGCPCYGSDPEGLFFAAPFYCFFFPLGLLRSVLGSSWAGRICLAVFSLLPSALLANMSSDACWEPYFGDCSGASQCVKGNLVEHATWQEWLRPSSANGTALLYLRDPGTWLALTVWSWN